VVDTAHQRLLGYLQAHEDAGVDPDARLVLRCDFNALSAAAAVSRFIDDGLDFSAIFCTGSVLTNGAYRELMDRNIAIPADMSFVGFDDQDWMTLVRPGITVVDQPRYRIGSICMNMLLAQIRGESSEAPNVNLPATLITRGSTGRVVV